MTNSQLAARRREIAALVFAFSILGCQKSLPTGPSDLMTGIVVYEHAHYVGESAHITNDVKDLKDFKGPCERFSSGFDGSSEVQRQWDDCVSSIRVAAGWRATLYRDDDFHGDRLDVAADVPNLRFALGRCDKGGFNDCVTSIRVFRP